MRNLILAVVLLGGVSAQAYSDLGKLTDFVRGACEASLEVNAGPLGQDYDIIPSRFFVDDSQALVASNPTVGGSALTRLKRLNSSGTVETFDLRAISYRDIIAVGTSVWFLQDNQLVEFDWVSRTIRSVYDSFPTPQPNPTLVTRARGFTLDGDRIYIAHGKLGVAVFNIKTLQHEAVITAGLRPASLAAAVAVRDSKLYVLQGAYHPQGFNGLAIVDMNSGSAHTVSYPVASGVVDPYTSSMRVDADNVFINNGGWVHVYKRSALQTAMELAPAWMAVSEKIQTAGGLFEKFLMIEGGFLIEQRTVLACSSIEYTPVGQRRPIKEWRFIEKHY